MTGRPFLIMRAALALALMIGFYALALGVIAGLLLFLYVQLRWSPVVWIGASVAAVVAVVVIIEAILPRPDRFAAPGPLLDRDRYAALMREIEAIAAATGQPVPQEIHLTGELDAWVLHRGGFAGLGGRRVMGIGLPLLGLLTVSELRAVIAHEFGHFHGGDTRIGAFVHRTRDALLRTVDALAASRSPATVLFRLYANLFLCVSLAVSRWQERVADQLAASVAGAVPMASGLKKVHRARTYFDAFMNEEVMPVVECRWRPTIVDGFQRYLAAASVARAADQQLERELTSASADARGSHPALRDRLRALEDLPRGEGFTRRAIDLIDDVAAVEGELAPFLFGANISRCPLLNWEEALDKIHRPTWRHQAQRLLPSLATITAGQLANYGLQFRRLGKQIDAKRQALEATEQAKTAVAVGLMFALEHAGWQLERNLGEPPTLRRGSLTLQPFAAVQRLASGSDSPAKWRAEMERLGIGEIRLGDALSATS